MKKLFTSLFLTFVILSGHAQTNTLKVQFLALSDNSFLFSYEKAVNPKQAFQFTAGYSLFERVLTGNVSRWLYKGITLIPEYRFFTSKKNNAPRGFYFSTFFRFSRYSVRLEDYDTDPENLSHHFPLKLFGFGVIPGYQILVSDVLAIDIFFGPQINIRREGSRFFSDASMRDRKPVDPLGRLRSGIRLRGGISLGIAF